LWIDLLSQVLANVLVSGDDPEWLTRGWQEHEQYKMWEVAVETTKAYHLLLYSVRIDDISPGKPISACGARELYLFASKRLQTQTVSITGGDSIICSSSQSHIYVRHLVQVNWPTFNCAHVYMIYFQPLCQACV
jgi:hypothetical protein